MAKGNMLLGQARGSVGDIVFSRSNGKQIIKAKSSEVKNPQTKAQMIQRILMNTISQAYSKMAEICDHSFEGIPAGQQSMSFFMQKNINLLRYTASEVNDLTAMAPCVTPLGSNGLASNSYVIAKGTLAEIIPEVSSGGAVISCQGTTYADVMAATGLQRGDQLTFILVVGSDLTNQKFIYSRVIMDPVSAQGEPLGLETAFLDGNMINAANPRNENKGISYTFDGNDLLASSTFGAVNMAACIASRQKADGSWLRSNATLLLAEGASIGYSIQDAYDAWYAGGIEVESSKYLNNALRNAGKGSAASGGNNTPSLDPPVISGETPFETSTTVTITAAQDATIHYTTDGSVPTEASPTYSAPFTLSATGTVKAIAVKASLVSTVAFKNFVKSSGGGDDDENT